MTKSKFLIPNGYKKQAGVTLLLSLLILSAVTAISFSLATIVFIETRASSDVQRTEPALYGTLAVLEDASFDIKRGAGNPRPTQMNCLSPGVCVNMTSTVSSLRDNTIIEKIPSTASDYNSSVKFYLINPDDLYTDVDGDGSPDGGYGKIRVTNIGNVPFRASLCKFTVNDCVSGTATWEFDTLLNPASSVELSITDDSFMPKYSYQLYLVYGGAGTTDAFAEIESFDANGSTPKGLPYFGQKLLDVQATYVGITRRYRALIPVQ
jgi:hypothetical protein